MSSHYKSLLQAKSDVDSDLKKDKRTSTAKYLLSQIGKGSIWLQKERIKLLALYIDLDFVKRGLVDLYKSVEIDIQIKESIKNLHDGKLDISGLIEEIKFQQSIEDAVEEDQDEIQGSNKFENISQANLLLKSYTSRYQDL